MPRYALTIQCDTAAELAAVARYLDRMPSAELAVQVRGSPQPEPANGATAAMTGNQLLGWIGDQPEPRVALRRTQDAGKKLGYGWQIKAWKPAQVADVCRELQHHGQMGAKA